MIRESESRHIARCIQSAHSCSVLGLSNMGKSNLLRELCIPAVRDALFHERADDYLFAYVDCNQMADRTDNALHEAALRSTISTLRRAGAQDQLLRALHRLHGEIAQPGATIRSSLAFDSAVRMVCEESDRMLVLLFDEFDEPFEQLDGRTFLNLRTIKDAHPGAIAFVAATARPLREIRSDNDSSQFSELFSTHAVWLGFSSHTDALEIAAEVAEAALSIRQAAVEKQNLDFIVSVAGGHAGLIKCVTDAWLRIASGMPDSAHEDAQDRVRKSLDSDQNAHNECARIWKQLTRTQQDALIDSFAGRSAEPEALEQLRTMRIAPNSASDVWIGSVWCAFVNGQARTRQSALP